MRANHSYAQYRYYNVPPSSHVLALLGSRWSKVYSTAVSDLHFHNCIEVGYCHDGAGILTFEDERREYASRMFSIIPPNRIHTTDSLNGRKCSWEFLFIDVPAALAEFYAGNRHMREQITQKIYRACSLVRHDDQPQAANLILAIMEEYRARSELYLESVRGLLRSFLIQAARIADESPITDGENSVIDALIPAIEYVASHYHEKIAIADLAHVCHLSETHFRRVFSKMMNISPHTYINRIRIEAACKLLATTDGAIGDIAVKTGFATITALNRNFMEIIGETPSHWRKERDYCFIRQKRVVIQPYEGWL